MNGVDSDHSQYKFGFEKDKYEVTKKDPIQTIHSLLKSTILVFCGD